MPISKEDEELMQEAAVAVVKRRLAVPAMMFLETVSPMNTLTSSMLHMITPIWGIALPEARLRQVAAMLERRETIPALIRTIDDAEEDRRLHEKAQRGLAKQRKREAKLEKKRLKSKSS